MWANVNRWQRVAACLTNRFGPVLDPLWTRFGPALEPLRRPLGPAFDPASIAVRLGWNPVAGPDSVAPAHLKSARFNVTEKGQSNGR